MKKKIIIINKTLNMKKGGIPSFFAACERIALYSLLDEVSKKSPYSDGPILCAWSRHLSDDRGERES